MDRYSLRKKTVGLLVASLLCCVPMRAQKTVVVLSDTHVMGPDLLVSDGTAWQNHLASSLPFVDDEIDDEEDIH